MQLERTNELLQVIASIGVMIGLLFVAYEIRQNTILAKAEAISAMQSGWEAISISEYESNIGELRAKSLLEPENLTDAEIYALSAWLSANVTQIDRLIEVERGGLGYGMNSSEMVQLLESLFDSFLNNRFGRAWYMENRFWMDPVIADVWDRKIEEGQSSSSDSYTTRIRERLQ